MAKLLKCASLSLLFAPLGACGLDRPIEPQPLVSVVDEWRQSVLEQNGQWLLPDGEPVEVSAAEVEGDIGELTWDAPLLAEASGSANADMVAVELLAGGGSSGDYGMAILGIYMPALADLEPGASLRVEATDATLVGCAGPQMMFWDYDEPAMETDVEVTADPAQPDQFHYRFVGTFADGSTMAGRFTVHRPSGSADGM